MDLGKLMELFQSAGYPTTIVGGIILLFVYFRRTEAAMREELNGSLERLKKEREEADARADKAEIEKSNERKSRIEAEGKLDEMTQERNKLRYQLNELNNYKDIN